jgi:hypothetical protein
MNSSIRNTSFTYALFLKNIGYFLFYRFLGMISVILLIGASLFLILWYSLITCSQFIDGYMEDIYENIDLCHFQKNIYNNMSSICKKINNIFEKDIIYPFDVNVNEEDIMLNYESNNEDIESYSEIENITDKVKTKQEKNKNVIDTFEEEDIINILEMLLNKYNIDLHCLSAGTIDPCSEKGQSLAKKIKKTSKIASSLKRQVKDNIMRDAIDILREILINKCNIYLAYLGSGTIDPCSEKGQSLAKKIKKTSKIASSLKRQVTSNIIRDAKEILYDTE